MQELDPTFNSTRECKFLQVQIIFEFQDLCKQQRLDLHLFIYFWILKILCSNLSLLQLELYALTI